MYTEQSVLKYQSVPHIKYHKPDRLGYYYQPSPVSDVQPYTQLLDTDQHVFSAGLGYAWRFLEKWITYPLEFDLYFQYKYLPERTLQTVAGRTTIKGQHINIGGTIQLQF